MNKFSIITAVYNRVSTIKNCVESVQNQQYGAIEHVVVDGKSTDGTLEVLKELLGKNSLMVSEKDFGIYDAINKGIKLSSGDIIGLMHSDDVFSYDKVLHDVAYYFEDPKVDAVYGDIVYFDPSSPNKVLRRYRSKRFSPEMISWGWMPAHTSLFLRKSVFDQFGLYKTNYRIAADFEFIARVFSSGNLNYVYLPKVLVRMAQGGVSTGGWKNTILLNEEVLRACRQNNIETNIFKILSKYPFKMMEYFYS